MKHKVLLYLLRPAAGPPELLVFEHRDEPAAGVQVPAGTVEPGETFESAAYRELHEESGLAPRQVRLLRQLTDFPEPAFAQHRHVFLFEPLAPLPDRWSHTVHGHGEDEGLVFNYYWLPAAVGLILAGGQHRCLPLALASLPLAFNRAGRTP